jgi:hypothetical protein
LPHGDEDAREDEPIKQANLVFGRWRDQPVDGKYIGEQLRQAAEAEFEKRCDLLLLRHLQVVPICSFAADPRRVILGPTSDGRF